VIPVSEALDLVLRASAPLLDEEEVPVERAVGRVLARPVRATSAQPPFDRVMMDGYAVRAADVTAGGALRVTGESPAGTEAPPAVAAGACVEVMTGGPLPPGADTVVQVEHTRREGDEVVFDGAVAVGLHIARLGSSARIGQELLPVGATITAVGVAAIAAAGQARVRVRRRPSLAIVTTGDELVDAHQQPGVHQIRDTNGVSLSAQALALGLDDVIVDHARDDRASLRSTLDKALALDLVVVSGGVSRGRYDLVPEVLCDLGVEPRFHRVAQKPGKPLWFGTRGTTLVFGAPGNPLATLVTFRVYVAAAVARMTGQVGGESRHRGILTTGARFRSSRALFALARATWRHDRYEVRPCPGRGSADVFTPARANALLSLPAGTHDLAAGAEVTFQLLNPVLGG